MIDPLVVPAHPVDNPPTDRYWPHVDERLEPLFHQGEGPILGPLPLVRAEIRERGDDAGAEETVSRVDPALLVVTDRRLMVLGRPGEGAPHDRRLVAQLRFDWCSEFGFRPPSGPVPARVMLGGRSVDEQGSAGVRLIVGLPDPATAAGFAEEVVRRIARRRLDVHRTADLDLGHLDQIASGLPPGDAAGFRTDLPGGWEIRREDEPERPAAPAQAADDHTEWGRA